MSLLREYQRLDSVRQYLADPRSSYFIPHWWKANMKRCFDRIINLSWLFSLACAVPSLGAGCYLNRLPGNLRSGVLYVFPTSSQKLSQCVCRALNSLSVFNQSELVSQSSYFFIFIFFWAEIWAWSFMNICTNCGKRPTCFTRILMYISGIVDWIIRCCGHKISLLLLVGSSDLSERKLFG